MIDRLSETWRTVEARIKTELVNATERIETLGVKSDETENLRGRIKVLRELLAMADEPQPNSFAPSTGYGFQEPGEV